AAIEAAATELADDPSLKAVVVTGGDRAFAAGADGAEFPQPGVAPPLTAPFPPAFAPPGAIPPPVIPPIQGFAPPRGLEPAPSRATGASPVTARDPGSRRSSSASCPARAGPSAPPGSSGRPAPRSSCGPAVT